MAIIGAVTREDDDATALTASRDVALFPAPWLGGWQARSRRRHMALQVEPRAAVSARHAVRFVCALWSVPNLYQTAAVCVTELVANAVKHAQWPSDQADRALWLTLSVAGPYLLVEVSDPDPTLPVVGSGVDWDRFDWAATVADDGRGESGFGLPMVVEQVREAGGEFGMALVGTGKTVFFALPARGRVPLARRS